MGYTHYFSMARPFTKDEHQAIMVDIQTIVECTSVPLAGTWGAPGTKPEFGFAYRKGDVVCSFNGIEEDGCETFHIINEKKNFNFVKTRLRPYDEVVTAILICMHHQAPDTFNYTSDGNIDEWQAGLELARKATGNEKLRVDFVYKEYDE